jgi:hypothetical protein
LVFSNLSLIGRLSFFHFSFKNKLNLKLNAMKQIIIKCHKPNAMYLGEHFYILCKGRNSGKPLLEPCANCWVLQFPNKQECENYYWMAYTLWQSKFWHYFLVGAVIPFLRLFEFKKEFAPKTEMLQNNYEQHLKNILALQLLQNKEAQCKKQLNLIENTRRFILQHYAQH